MREKPVEEGRVESAAGNRKRQPSGREPARVVVEHREPEHADVRAALDDAAGRVDAVWPGQVEVPDDDVGLELERLVDRLGAGRRLADHVGNRSGSE